MNRADLLSGLFIVGFGLFIVRGAGTLKYSYEHGPGPGFLPFWIGVLLLALAFILVAISAFYSKRRRKTDKADWWKTVRVMGTWGAFLFTIALMDKFGFLLSFAVFTVFLIFVVDRQSFSTAIAVSLGTALGFYLIFLYTFGLRLPVGPWGF